MIENTLIVTFIWAAGLLLQAFLLAGGRWKRKEWKQFAYCVFLSFFGFLPGRGESEFKPHFHILASFVIFTFSFALSFQKKILPIVSEHVLLIWNILFLSIVLPFSSPSPWLLALVMIPSGATLLLASFPLRLPALWKGLFYVWFLIMVVVIGIAQAKLSVLSIFFDESSVFRMRSADAFFGGMAFMSIGVYLALLIRLIPIPAKHQSMADRLKLWRDDVQLMIQRFSDEQLRVKTTLAIILVLGGVFLCNVHWNILSHTFLVNIIIVLTPWFLRMFGQTRQAELK